ncbi:hypothetical protein D3C76_1472180 [compost metagenome]
MLAGRASCSKTAAIRPKTSGTPEPSKVFSGAANAPSAATHPQGAANAPSAATHPQGAAT